MTVDVSGRIIKESRYWNPSYIRNNGNKTLQSTTSELNEYLQRSVIMRTRSDVPLTACLSGGIDSSTLVSLLSSGIYGAGQDFQKNNVSKVSSRSNN